MMRNLVIFSLLGACEAILPALPVPTEAEARKEIEAAEPMRQLMLLEANVSRNPDNANAHLWLARRYRDDKDERAKVEYQRAIELAPADPVPRIELAWLSIEPDLRRGLDPSAEAIDAAEDLIRPVAIDGASCPTRGALVGLYEVELEAGRVDPLAEAFLVESIAACSDPALVPAWKGTLGRTYAAQGKLAEAAVMSCAAVTDGAASAAPDCAHAASGGRPDAFQPATVGEWLAAAEIASKAGDDVAKCSAFERAIALDAGEDLRVRATDRGCK